MLDVLITLDRKMFLFVQEHMHTPFFDFWMPIITDFDYTIWKIPIWKIAIILFLLSLAIWGGKKGRIVAGLVLVVFGLANLMSSDLMKPIFSRARPYMSFKQISPLVESAPRYSFPSTHATNIFATMLLLAFYYRKFLLLNLFIAFMVSFSRVYVGVHYPSDVVAGAILGTACACVVVGIERLINKKCPTIQLSKPSAENADKETNC
ncbi:MAG: phosphatase PAP2 family protein [Candidatus Ratteibacteria bacterium]|nr:phosphatase PAP2 family protein [Candidatus Ratteibacteria bacterium]